MRQGSGFLVQGGYILTSGALLKGLSQGGPERILVYGRSLPVQEARLVRYVCSSCPRDARGPDLGLLELPAAPAGVKPVVFSLDLKNTDLVFALGYPQGLYGFREDYGCVPDSSCAEPPGILRSTGTVNSIFSYKGASSGSSGGSPAVSHGAPIDDGMMGGPLLNYRGEAVGMNFSVLQAENDNVSFSLARPSSVIVDFLRQSGVVPSIASGQGPGAPPRARAPADPPGGRNVQDSQGGRNVEGAPKARQPQGGGKGSPPLPPAARGDSRLQPLNGFTLDVPKGWAVLDVDQISVLLGSPEGKSTVGIIMAEGKGASVEGAARAYMARMDGSGLERISREGPAYSFDFTPDGGGEGLALVVGDEGKAGRHFLIYISGNISEDGVLDILESLSYTDSPG
jgi:S1-C subfamily serine protease